MLHINFLTLVSLEGLECEFQILLNLIYVVMYEFTIVNVVLFVMYEFTIVNVV